MKSRVLAVLHSDEPKEVDEAWRKIRRGWVFGSDEFCLKIKAALDASVAGKRRDSFMGDEICAHDEEEAERLLALGLNACGLSESDLPAMKKGDDRKKVIAWLIRQKTSVRVEWITRRLHMGTTSNFSRYIRVVEGTGHGDLFELRALMTKKAD